MSKWIDRILGTENYDDFADDYDDDSFFAKQQKRDNELKEKIFSDDDLTFEEFTRLMDITLRKFKSSFGCFGTDYEVVFRKKSNQLVKKKMESEKGKNEK